MDGGDGCVLICSANMEWTNPQGVVQRKVTHKKATLRLIRNESRAMFLEITSEKSAAIRLQLKGISVHKKFMSEGKTSIKFQEVGCMVFLSNAPPSSLFNFLKTIFVKMTGEKAQATTTSSSSSLRTQVLSKQNSFEDISPVTVSDLTKAHAKVTRKTDTTPSPLSRKRKMSDGKDDKAPKAKRIYSSSPLPTEIMNEGQKEVLESCLAGHNVFFTGSAGTGKSYLLKKIISALPPDVTIATASTGVAACHIGGITLHQFAGIGGGEATLERSYEMASKPQSAVIWRKCKHLIIDEISMIDGKYFEKIEAVARYVRKNDRPFGGIQLILCGDFLQLPPVTKAKENLNKNGNDKRFCFQTEAWNKCVHRCFELTEVHRQVDKSFIDILNSIRMGKVTDEITSRLLATSKKVIEQNGILATRLCSHTNDANIINESKLNALPGEAKTFIAQDSDIYVTKQLDQQLPVPGKLILKIGAQVMLLKNINISTGLVNGARGVVKEFKEGLPVVQFRNILYTAKHEKWTVKTAGGAMLSRKQIPLKLAWAFSIHKSQGLTLDCVEMSLAKVFEAGQAYVALSRAQSLETLRVLDFKASQVWANPDVLKFYKRLKSQIEETRLIPLGRPKQTLTTNKPTKSKPINKKLFSSAPLVSIS